MAQHDLQKFLTEALSRRGPKALPYPEPAKYSIRQHLSDLSQEMPSLSIADEEFTYDDGRSIHALKAHGTIPMYYQGAKYNIPVAVWLAENYPRLPPIVYVEPTPDMIIKPRHTFVDTSGRVDIPYIREWSDQRSNLVDLCWTLGISFGEDPPLFSKPPGWTPPPPTPRPPAPQPPPPAAHQPFHNPMNAPPGAANSYSQQPRPPQGGNPYAQPPRPAPGGDPYAADPYANPIAFHNPYAAQPGPPPRPAAAPNPYATAQPPPPPAPQPPRPPPPPPQQQQQLNPAELAFRKAAITSLTERLKASLQSHSSGVLAEAAQLREIGQELDSRHAQLQAGFNALEAERTALERNVGTMTAKTAEMDAWLAANEGKAARLTEAEAEAELERAIQPADSLSRQALSAASEDVAIEDALYALERALQAGILAPEAYIKQVRKICRKQFFPRALAMKIAGLQQAQRQQAGPSAQAASNGAPQAREMQLPQGDSWVHNSGHFQRPADGGAAAAGGWSNPLMRG